jgi:hypothetical protein
MIVVDDAARWIRYGVIFFCMLRACCRQPAQHINVGLDYLISQTSHLITIHKLRQLP